MGCQHHSTTVQTHGTLLGDPYFCMVYRYSSYMYPRGPDSGQNAHAHTLDGGVKLKSMPPEGADRSSLAFRQMAPNLLTLGV